MNVVQTTGLELAGTQTRQVSVKEPKGTSSFKSMLESIQSKPEEQPEKVSDSGEKTAPEKTSSKKRVAQKPESEKQETKESKPVAKENQEPSVTITIDMTEAAEKMTPCEFDFRLGADMSSALENEQPLDIAVQSEIAVQDALPEPVQNTMTADLLPDTKLEPEEQAAVADAALLNEETVTEIAAEAPVVQELAQAENLSKTIATEEELPVEKKDEAQVKPRKENGPLVTVVDQRTELSQSVTDDRAEPKKVSLSSDVHAENLASQTFHGVEQNVLSANSQTAAGDGSAFQQMVNQQIQQNAPEFVKATQFVLKDNNSGSINIIMKPENLGNVKISIQLSDKVIAGQITVTTKEAFEAFKQNIDVLKQAFQNSGFDDASFNLNLAQNNSNSFLGQGHEQSSEQFLSNKAYRDYAGSSQASGEAVSGAAATAYNNAGNYTIDVVA